MEITTVPETTEDCENLLLSKLPKAEYEILKPHLELVPTPSKTVLFERGKEIKYVYFPVSGAHSVLALMKDGSAVEIGTIGREGLSTVDVLTGSTVAMEMTICQIAGHSLRMPFDKYIRLRPETPELQRLSYRFLQAYLSQVSQSVACNRLHSTSERFARWILISHDRVNGDTFGLTQEFLADMLGVHRPSISLVAKEFQDGGMLKYHRGIITVLDRKGLEGASCECYEAVRKKFSKATGNDMG